MPLIDINDAHIYYERFDSPHSERLPIVLIHGSTQTGAADWGFLAPVLAQNYPVIVLDCRGHGQSSNPRHSYAFREMAGDVAGLIRALGVDRAHLIGHSNGGNVALVTLLEHPDVVQTAVLQAANAFVSPDLLEREPPLFDPDRVEREDPLWKARMVALHGPTHGPDYWRDLLRLTLQETLSQPNYTAANLAKVRRPVLVIQGEADPVNAPARHAQFIARHIPLAERWLPRGVAHNVHFEATPDWLKQVLDFLARRGDDDNEALHRLRHERYADEREAIFEVRASGAPAKLTLTGRVLRAEQREAAVQALPAAHGVRTQEVQVLLGEFTSWALVSRPVADLRREPRSLAERMSQALLGEAVRWLGEKDGWVRVRLEDTGYLGWLDERALHFCRGDEVTAYRAACNAVVAAGCAPVHHPVPPPEGERISSLPFGVRVVITGWQGAWASLRLPDGSAGWVARADLLPLTERPGPDPDGIARAVEVFKGFVGTPYLWGGRTPFGFDCSGFAQAFWGFLGIRIPRDADQQFRAGTPVHGDPQPGDLLFFGDAEAEGERPISHVAISLGGSELIHANRTTGNVACNSVDAERPRYRAWLRDHLAGVRRFG